ncbi:hypothetical protein [Brachybacterium phenoliresistens]|uniref:hypothetical protein n=1 Tax=Brachybacterium phenoliresistens TaxID=396014 RepID=UPI0031DD1A95
MTAIDPARLRARHLVGGALLVGALMLTGCQVGTGDIGPDEQSTPGTSAPAGGAAGAPSEDAVVDEDAAAAGVDLTALGEPVASAEVPAIVEGDPAATMTVSLHGLRREGGTLVATYSFTVHSETSEAEGWIYDYLGSQGWHPYAIDTVNLNKHEVLGGGAAQTDYQGAKFRPGQTLYAYASFAAPPEDVTTMDVLLVEGAPLASGVPIS